MRGLWRATIWHPGALPITEGAATRELKRVVLSLFDVVIIIMGAGAVRNGMPSFDLAFFPWVSTLAAWALLVAGALAFLGISFPRLWVAEAIGKLVMVSVLGGYAGALWALALTGSGGRAFVAGGLTAIIVLPMWNLSRLGRERLVRRTLNTIGGPS
jgi:hypothetical protein